MAEGEEQVSNCLHSAEHTFAGRGIGLLPDEGATRTARAHAATPLRATPKVMKTLMLGYLTNRCETLPLSMSRSDFKFNKCILRWQLGHSATVFPIVSSPPLASHVM